MTGIDKVEVEIFGLSNSPNPGGAHALLLKEVYGNRRLPIIIGLFEAQAIAVVMEGYTTPRPLTHDLLSTLIVHLGANVNEVIIDALRDNTFHAKIILDVASITSEIDSRPSDAIALAVRVRCPIFVAESVMKSASYHPQDDEASNENDFIDEIEHDAEEAKDEEESTNNSLEARISSLQEYLRQALEKEDYERAARLRDEINKLNGNPGNSN